jgi:uncharacterized protein YbjT (DUF2867 family)
MAEQVFITGGSGFVGSAVIGELARRGVQTVALMNRKPVDGATRSVPGDLFDSAAIASAMAGCSAVIHLVGIIMEKPGQGVTFERIHFQGTKSIVDAAKSAGVKRYLHMSALGVRADAASEYHRTKFAAEEYVRSSGLDWTILRPSLIHGPSGEFMRMEIRWARKTAPPFFAMPYFGAGLLGLGGAGKLQPIYVNDVARAFADSLMNGNTIARTFELGGSQQLTWPQLHQTVAQAVVKHRRLVIPMPAPLGKFLAAIGVGRLLGFNRDQIIMSQENNTCDLTDFAAAFGWTPGSFAQTLAEYQRSLE